MMVMMMMTIIMMMTVILIVDNTLVMQLTNSISFSGSEWTRQEVPGVLEI